MTRILIVLIAALAVAPAALADGFAPLAAQNGEGVLALDGKSRFVALGTYSTAQTMLARIDSRTGSVLQSVSLGGSWGIPIYSYGPNSGEGLSRDGKTLVVADIAVTLPRTKSEFLFLDPHSFKVRGEAVLKGDFAYDALSPDGSRLYLIQHQDVLDQQHYIVRAYDIRAQRLLPGRVADPAQKTWVMDGYPISRATSPDGRWVYTLYGHPNGFPFVHALDTVRGVARCIGLPWRGGQNAVYNMRVALHGKALQVHWLSGRPWYVMDTRTWKLSPDRPGGFPWWWTLALVAALMIAVSGRAAHHRARRRVRGDEAGGGVQPVGDRGGTRGRVAAAGAQGAG